MRFERGDWKSDEASLNKQLGLLAAAIRVETFGKEFYQRMSECIKDREGKLILMSLSRDEKEHRAWLMRQIDRIFPGKDAATIAPDPEYANVVPTRAFPDIPEGACLSPKDEIKAVEMAIEIEKASVRMYRQVAGMTQDMELKMLMQKLADWEREHQRVLEENLDYLRRGGSWYGYNPILDG